MPITLITGPANAGKAHAVMDALRRHVAHGEQPLLVLPTSADVHRYERELAQDGPVCGVHVCLFSGLLERVAHCAALSEPVLGRPPLPRLARERMLATLMRSSQEAPVSKRRLVQALGSVIAELQSAEVSPARLRAALGASREGGGLRMRLLLELHRRYNDRLARCGVLDAELRARKALDVLRRSPSLWRANSRPQPVVLYGFDDLTALQIDAIETLGRNVDAPVTVSLAYERGRVAFAGRAWAFEELAPLATEHVELRARDDYYAPCSQSALHRIERRLFEAEEVEDVLASTDGVDLFEAPTEHDELQAIARRVRALLDDGVQPAEIAIVHRSPASIATALARSFDAVGVPHLIERCATFADTSLGRALNGLLACGCSGMEGVREASAADLMAWLRAPGLLERPELADRLEEGVLRTGIRDAAGARELWERERWPLDAIERVAAAAKRGPALLLERAQRELLALFSAPRAHQAAVLHQVGDESASALRAGLKAISQLHELAQIAPDLVGGAAGVLDALRECALDQKSAAHAEGVALLPPLSLRARRVRALFVCGLQEGVFPAVGSQDPILGEEDRTRIAAICGSRLARRQDALSAERHLLYETLSRPEELLHVSWHACSDEGVQTPPSLFVDDLKDVFGGLLNARRLEVAKAAQARDGLPGARRESGLGGLLDERLLGELRERRLWSASSLELWAACPVRWFVERLLAAKDLDPEPEPLARGSLAHAVLSDVLHALRSETGSARMSAVSLPRARALAREALTRREQEMPLSVRPERLLIARRRLQADLDRYLEFAAQQESPLEPVHLELSFGLTEQPDGLPPLQLAEDVLLRGRIDRVDVSPDGKAVVYDYKSGRTGPEHSGARWAQGGRFQIALYMRAVSDLVGLEPVGGLYQPLAGTDLRARGALCSDACLDLECVRTDAYDGGQLEELIDAASNAALQAATEARAGLVQPRPHSCAYGGGCMYPAICRCDN